MSSDIQKYLINLPHRKQRLYNSLTQLRKVELDNMITIVKGVSPEKARQQQFSRLTKRGYQNIQNPQSSILIPNYQALACSISHRNCWVHMVLNDIEEALIIEDDIEIVHPEFFRFEIEQMREVVSANSHKCIYIIFNGQYIRKREDYFFSEDYQEYSYQGSHEDLEHITNQYDNYQDIKYFPYIDYSVIGCHFYYVNLKMASFFLTKLKQIQYQIDIEISNLASVYSSHLFLNFKSSSIKQGHQFPSDIQFYLISKHEISRLLNLNLDLSDKIWGYLSPCFRR